MNEKYFDRDEAIAFLAQHDFLLKRDYEFRFANAEAFSLLHMPTIADKKIKPERIGLC